MAVTRKLSWFLPDPQQTQAIEHVHGPMLVVAGAGTGKTTVLIRRIARLIREAEARPHEIIALTYTDNAASQMRNRLVAELGRSEIQGLQVCTFHAYCNQLLIAADRKFGVLDDKQLWIFLRRNLRELKLNYFVRAANVSRFLDDLLDFIRRCHDELVTPEDYGRYVRRIENGELPLPRVTKSKDIDELSGEEALGRCREIAFVFETVEGMLNERNLGTFNHMIVRANALLASNPDVLSKARKRAKFILVDEFQDANYAQIEILGKIAGREASNLGSESAHPAPPNLFVVGDPDQGIYRFRGASSEAFDLFLERFPDAKLVPLTRNRRSTAPILKCAHAVIEQNPEISTQSGTAYRREALVSARDEQEPQLALKRSLVEAVLVTGTFMEATDLVATLIERRKHSRCQWKDMAVLYRIHTHREEVASELARNGVPFSIEAMDVLDTPEVRDLLACLASVFIPGDSVSLFRLAALRRFDCDPEALRSAMKSLPRDSNAGLLQVLPDVPGGAEVLAAIHQSRAAVAGLKASAALTSLTRQFHLPRNSAINALLEFTEKWEEFPLTESGSPVEFLEYLDYFREARGTVPLALAEEENSVKLMTVHGAKGLEYEHVFLLRAIKPSFPAAYRESLIDFPSELRNSKSFSSFDDRTLCDHEERRLFYVAMTRARDTLTIYAPFGRGERDKTPPGFLRELLKARDLKSVLRERNCREFQTGIFGQEQLGPSSRLSEWVSMSPSSDLSSTLSASAIDNYKLCPLRFKLDREWRIPGEVSAALQYGASMHRVLRTYYDSVRLGRPKSEMELLQVFREDLKGEMIADPYQHDLYEQQGMAQLKEFFLSAQENHPQVLHTEEYFKIRIGETALVGRIDRMDRAGDGRVVIVDYKTGKPKSQEDADQSLQLSLYALAARERWGYIPERLAFHNLDGNSVITTARSAMDLEEARNEVAKIAAKIAEGKFEPKIGYHCNSCAYRGICPKTEKRVPEIALVAEQVY
jgi:DNA helicase II / ATP-dependent DNA helicase PcrA